jgi:hypothetical protein
MAQLVTRVDDPLVGEVDGLIADGTRRQQICIALRARADC